MVKELHGDDSAFALTAVEFTTILFLDDDLDGVPTVRVALDTSYRLTITSRREQSSWDTHSSMELRLQSDEPESLDLPAVQARCTEQMVSFERFYEECGNDYQGEFKAMRGQARDDGVEILSKVGYQHNETNHVFAIVRAAGCCLHAPYYWSEHRNRPFYIASVTSYAIRSMDTSRNKTMWSLMHGLGGSDDHSQTCSSITATIRDVWD